MPFHRSRSGAAIAVVAALAAAAISIDATPPESASASTGAGGKVDVIYSAYNDSSTTLRLSAQSPTSLAPVSDAQASLPTIVLDPSVTFQTWEGFGGSLEDTSVYDLGLLSATKRAAALDALFNPQTGNNFNLMRIPIGCADFCRDYPNYWTYDDNGGGADPTLANFSIQKDIDNGLITMLQQIMAINPDARFYSSMWSPPAWMKTTGSITGPASGGLCPTDGTEPRVKHGSSTGSSVDYYPVLANYYVKYIQAYKALGIPIYAVTLQNEPDITMPYPATCFTPTQLADFAIVLKSAFATAGISTKIWGLDDNEGNTFPYADALLANATANAAVDGLGWHNYGGTQVWQPSAVHAQFPDKTAHITEITNGADRLVEYFRNWVSSYSYWVTMYQFLPGPGPGFWQTYSSTNPDFYAPSIVSFQSGGTSDYQLNGWYYSFGQFSRYIQPGAVRIDSTDRIGNLTNVSFRNPDGTIVTVVVNRIATSTNSAVQNTPSANFRVVTPDGQFTDTIPGDTIATYIFTPTTGDAVSLKGATATASASNAGYSATQAIDSSSATVWTSGANQASGWAFTIDLGSAKSFDQISLNLGSLGSDSAAGYQVLTSSNGSTWGSAIATGTGTKALTNITVPATTTRYLRIELTSSASRWWSIASLSLFDSSRGLLPIVGATVSASATGGSDLASRAIDGIESTRWTTGAAQANGQTFTVDLGSARTVNALELDVAANTGDHPRGWSLATSTNGTTWSSPVAVGTGFGPSTQANFPAVSTRYLRITQTGTASSNYWSIAELRVYNKTPIELSRSGWAATASVAPSSAVNALDGAASTRWTTGVAQATGQWLQLDMKKTTFTSGISLDVTTSTGDYPRGYTVAVSDDATNWQPIATGNAVAGIASSSWRPQSARYLRVTLSQSYGSAYWSIGEATVWGVKATASLGTPLSRTGWTVTASHTASGSAASNAIDGLLDTRWSDGAAQVGGEWFQLDLGTSTSVSTVQLVAAGNPDNDNGDYPRGYEVYVSTGSGWTLVAAGSGAGNALTITFPTQNVRFINVHETGTSSSHWWSIAEISVFS
jgi:O-glycosyl hydrolase